jgi:striatin 1/3/4
MEWNLISLPPPPPPKKGFNFFFFFFKKKKKKKTQATLRSHFDAVRCLSFHPSESLLLTASEDATAKLWSLEGLQSAGKKAVYAADLEPVYTFRGHSGMVLACTMGSGMGPEMRRCYTAGTDMAVRPWRLPDHTLDPYSSTNDDNHMDAPLVGHTDAVWSLASHPFQDLVLSASADGTVRLWKPSNASSPLTQVFRLPPLDGASAGSVSATSCEFLKADPRRLVAGYVDGRVALFDAETAKCLEVFESDEGSGPASGAGTVCVNKVACDLELVAAARDNARLTVYDAVSGKIAHAMVAHTDSVTSLAFDPSGKYLATSGHDASVRFWDYATWGCVQEISLHRRKDEEAVHALAYHQLFPYFATAGADSTVKLLH